MIKDYINIIDPFLEKGYNIFSKVKKKIFPIILLSISFNSVIINAQQNLRTGIYDSLKKKTFKELVNQFYLAEREQDSSKLELYASIYLAKAKEISDPIKIAEGYHFFAYLNRNNSCSLKYADSIIEASKNFPNNKYPAQGYLAKAYYLYKIRDFKKTLDNYLSAYQLSKNLKNEELAFSISHEIGILKNRIGFHKEALHIYQNSLRYLSKNDNIKRRNEKYRNVLFSLSVTHRKLGQIDSVSLYNKLGIKESIKNNDSISYYKFVLNEGINLYNKRDYSAAIDSINKSILKVNELNQAIGFHYLGKINKEKGDIDGAILYFKKVDTIFIKYSDLNPELREGYEILINYYDAKNDNQSQLVYIKRLLKIDSILNSNYKYLNERINKKYDTPKLIHEKERIIDDLKDEEEKSKLFIYVLFIISVVLLFLLIYNYTKKRIYKIRFENLINENEKKQLKNDKATHNSEPIGISSKIIDDIINKLDKFEKSDKFIEKNITSSLLAKKFNTNIRYLSKIINTYKKKSVVTYLNDLRIEYTIQKLKNEKRFRKFTIHAIANEVGFNTSEAFSKAFHKKTGIYPSYFIKQLDKL